MHRKPVFPAFAAALAALATGCEWTGTSSSDSWSGSYDAMNFSGSYRSASELKSGTESRTTTTTSSGTPSSTDDPWGGTTGAQTISTREDTGKSYNLKGETVQYSGVLQHSPVVLSSVQIQLGGVTFTGDGSGNLVSEYGSGKITSSGAWSVTVNGDKKGTESGEEIKVDNEYVGTVKNAGKFDGVLKHSPLVSGSVQINFANGMSFYDDGNRNLRCATEGAGGHVTYQTGSIQLDWLTADMKWQKYDGKVWASYSYYDNVSGSSGLQPQGSGSIVAVYQYTTDASTSSSSSSPTTTTTTTTTTTAYSTDAEAVARSSSQITAITVSQSGQNLSMSTNTGIVMSGKFTAVRETRVASDSGTATYNAQFQVTSAAGHKFVGTLNYDASSGHRTLNGTLTQGKAVYDVQGVGPAF